MIGNHLHTVLPIYDSVSKQFFRNNELNDVCTFRLLCGRHRLLPFQFRRTPDYNTISSIMLMCYNESYSDEILPNIPADDLDIQTAGGYDYITYFGAQELDELLPCGDYYLKITDGAGNIWYSEVFHVTEDVDDNIVDYRISRGGDYREHTDDELRIWRD